MGIDTELIDDGTYFVVELGVDIAGCGGWSRRATLYGGNQTPGRDSKLLDPSVDPARVRAMYTNPEYARRGVGRMILSLCEAAAAAEGFTRLELMSTLSGEPLYTAYGFRPLERLEDSTGGVPVPLIRMEKAVDPSLLPLTRGHAVPAGRREGDGELGAAGEAARRHWPDDRDSLRTSSSMSRFGGRPALSAARA